MDLVPFAGYISDDSDFCGTPKARRKLEARSKKTTTKQLVQRWDRDRAAHPTASITATSSNIVEQTLYNRLEGVPTARQLDETVDEFLKRLPPRTTFTGDWIWVTCPILKGRSKAAELRHAPDLKESLEQMMNRARALLSQFVAEKERLVSANPNSAQSTITRKLGPLRERLKEDILDSAVASGVTNGKWMLFPKPEDVNRAWKLVAEAVVDGRLGETAKVAPADPPDPFGAAQKQQASHLICVYTRDFSDLDDVRKVLEELIELGLAPRNAANGAIYYKADAYTYLDIDSGQRLAIACSTVLVHTITLLLLHNIVMQRDLLSWRRLMLSTFDSEARACCLLECLIRVLTPVFTKDFYSASFTIARAIVANRSENHVFAPIFAVGEARPAAIAIQQLSLSSKAIE